MRRLVALVFVGALVAAACGDESTSPAADSPPSSAATSVTTTSAAAVPTSAAPITTAPPATTTPATETTVVADTAEGCDVVPTEMRTLVDETRPTPATGSTAELDSRTLDVWVDRPAEPGPWPLLVFAHGLTGHPRSHETHRSHLAAACFVVVAPAFPLTNNDVANAWLNAGDVSGQFDDVSFLIDEMLADPELSAAIDGERIGVIGHSLGGLTTAGAAISPGADQRITAAVVMSAGFVEARDDVAVMVLHGDADTVVPVGVGTGAYDLLEGRAVMVTLLGGDHLSGITDGESDYGPVVRGVTAAFFAHELENRAATVEVLFELPLDLAAIEARTADGPLDDWTDYFAA